MARFYFSNETSDTSGYKTLFVNEKNPRATSSITLLTTAATQNAQLAIAGTAAKWITKPFAKAVTINSAVVLSVWAKEGSLAANAAIGIELYKFSAGSEAATFWPVSNGVTELTAALARTVSVTTTGTSTSFAAGDRLVAKLFNINVGAIGGAGEWTNVDIDGRDEGADGDSFFDIAEAVNVNERQSASGTTCTTTGASRTFYQNIVNELQFCLDANIVASSGTVGALMDELGFEARNN